MALEGHLAELCTRAKFGMALGLERVRAALAEVGDPHLELACVHVAGSNGKGSTSAMVESIARAAGLRTGLYTSPHLARFAERIRIGGEPIEDAAFEHALSLALRSANRELTFFECLTVAAFVAFRAAAIDLAVLEVGLGGRLDATNVVPSPLACAITSISLEHTRILGDTVDLIAREKAGILKPGAPYLVAHLPPEAESAIDEIARAVSAGPKWRVRDATSPEAADVRHRRADHADHAEPAEPAEPADRAVEITGPGGLFARATPGLLGRHQAANAALACALAWKLSARWPSLQAAIPAGLASARWPGRFEKIAWHRDVTVLLDGAHNDEGAAALVQTLHDEAVAPERTVLVFGALADKAYEPMLERVAPRARARVYTAPKGRAPALLADLTHVAPGENVADPIAALARAFDLASPGDTILVTGSLYLVGELRAHLLGLAVDPFIAL